MMSSLIRIERAPATFSDWGTLLTLLREAFAPAEARIDPPSSVFVLTPATLEAKSRDEVLFLAYDREALVGCVFAKRQGDTVYVGKLAVREDRRGAGIARGLIAAAETYALTLGAGRLTLETRIELTDNHATFSRLGFVKVAERAHAGFDRPTFIEMEKHLSRTVTR